MTERRALWTLIAVSSLLRFALAMSVGGFGDEAYYALYGRNLDWAFFDHPPMVGVVAAAGEVVAGWINPLMGLRFGSVVMFAGSTWLLARLTERFFGARAGFLAALVLNSTVFFGLVVGVQSTPDAPLLFFWLLTLDRLAVALGPDGRTSSWVGVGLAWGGAMLSKYHAVLLPAGALLYLVVRPQARRCLRTPGPYLASAIGLAAFAPVVAWNAAHGWASFLFHARRSGGVRGVHPTYVLEAIVGQIGYLFPWFWVGLVVVLFRLLRRGPRRWTDAEAFLTCQAVPAIALFMGVSTFSRIMTHWPLIGFVALMPVLGRNLSDRLDCDRADLRPWLALALAMTMPVLLGVLFAAHTNLGLFQDGRGRLLARFAPEKDMTIETLRWDQIAGELRRRGLTNDPNTFLFTDNWRFSAQLSLAVRHEAPVACFHRDARSFTFWSRPEDYVGRDGIFVRVIDSLAYGEHYIPWFRQIEPIAEFPITRGGSPMQTVILYRCVHLNAPYRFGYTGDGPIPLPDASAGVATAKEPVAASMRR